MEEVTRDWREVVADQAAAADSDRVASGCADQSIIDAREFHTAVVDLAFLDLSAVQVDRPAPQRGVRFELATIAPHFRVANYLQHNRIPTVVRIGDVEDIARVDVEPAHGPLGVVAAQHGEPGAVVIVPPVRQVAFVLLCERKPEIEDQRQVHEDDMFSGQREVVHQRQTRDVEGPADNQFTIGVCAPISDVRLQNVAATGLPPES